MREGRTRTLHAVAGIRKADVPSKSQVNKAGRVLRHSYSGIQEFLAFSQAYEVLIAFRAAHGGPLQTANMGLRSVVNTEKCRVEVSQ